MRHNKVNSDVESGYSPHALISKAEAGRVLDISQRSVRRLVQAGVLEEIRLGAGMRPRLRLADVLALVQPREE